MLRPFLVSLTAAVMLTGSLAAADEQKDKDRQTKVTVTKIDPQKGDITVRLTDNQGKSQERTFHLTHDIRLLDETGRVVAIDVFQSGNEALIVESGGKLKELRRLATRGRNLTLTDTVRTLIEMSDQDKATAEELQKTYDLLRKLDTNKNGKLDPQALKAESENILQERVKEVFNRLDTDKDGKISKDEARGRIKEDFDRIDANHDGFITLDELMKAAKERHEAAAPKAPEKEKK